MQLIAQLAETRITTGELIGLRVGDIITTEKDVHDPLVICVEGVPKFRAQAGAFKGRKAIRIEKPIGMMPAAPAAPAAAPAAPAAKK